jgi:hypothetical protein
LNVSGLEAPWFFSLLVAWADLIPIDTSAAANDPVASIRNHVQSGMEAREPAFHPKSWSDREIGKASGEINKAVG